MDKPPIGYLLSINVLFLFLFATSPDFINKANCCIDGRRYKADELRKLAVGEIADGIARAVNIDELMLAASVYYQPTDSELFKRCPNPRGKTTRQVHCKRQGIVT